MKFTKRLFVLPFVFSFAVACDRAITEPTRVETPATSSTLAAPTAPTAPTTPTSGADVPSDGVKFTGPPAPGCQPASEALEWVVTVTNAPELVRLYGHAFRDPVAGCENTIHLAVLAWRTESKRGCAESDSLSKPTKASTVRAVAPRF